MDWKLYFLKYIFIISLKLSAGDPVVKSERYISLSEYKNDEYKRFIMRKAKVAEMNNFMDENVDPCHDFYEFSCGNWKKINEAKNEPTTGFFEILSKGFYLKVAKELSETSNANDTEVDKTIKRFYKSCLKLYNVPLTEYRSEFIRIIERYGAMPVLQGNRWNKKNFDWLEVLARIQSDLDIEIIIGTDIMADFKNTSINRIYFGQAKLMLESKSMYLDNSNRIYRKLYVKRIKDQLIKYLQVSEQLAQKTAQEIVDFEISLAEGMLDDHLSLGLDETTVLIDAENLGRKYEPHMDLNNYLKISFREDITVNLYEYKEQYQKNLKKVIERTPKATVANYIFFMLVSEFFPRVSKKQDEQEEICLEAMNKHFASNIDNMIYRRYNTKDTEHDVNVIWNEIKNAFKSELSSSKLNWISPQTRAIILRKLNAMKLEINSYLDTNFTEEFGELVIDNMNFISNLRNLFENNAKKSIAKLHEPPKPFQAGEELSYTPANVILENKIIIPVSLLQPNYLWGDNYPTALKFGTLGFLLGHELVHGFDDAGRDYDENGNQGEWWDARSKKTFEERTKCFMSQYHEYIFGDMNLPLSEAQSENIADNGGLKIAYNAYINWLLTMGTNGDLKFETFPGMIYSPKQLFFISFAQIWCSDTHPNMRGLQTATDEHTPGEFRVIGVLSNSAEFADAFNCSKQSKMVSIKPCQIY